MKNSNFKYVNAKEDWENYTKVRRVIVNLYNESSPLCNEDPELEMVSRPELLHSFSIKGNRGGVLIEQLVGNERFAMVNFAGIQKELRGKKVFSKLFLAAESYLNNKSIRIVGVLLNPTDSEAMWRKYGFTEEAIMRNGIKALVLPND